MLTNEQFIEDRKKTIKSIFKNKSTKWVNDNIIYNFFDKTTKLTDKDFRMILTALKNLKKITPLQIQKMLYWIENSYTPYQIMKKFFPHIIYPTQEIQQRGIVKYFIHKLPNNNIFVSFRGTKTFWEAINGIKFYRVPFFPILKDKQKFFIWRDSFIKSNQFEQLRIPLPNDKDIEIHKGFLDEANIIYADFIKNISSIVNSKTNNLNFILCGHSLGGVLAQIIGMYFSHYFSNEINNGKISISIITANMPPIGNKNFNLLIPYFNIKNYIRLYNYQDFVPYYGYLGSWIERKRFRHIDYMLKDGISDQESSTSRTIITKLQNTNIYVRDFGKNLEKFLADADNKNEFNYKYIYHDIIRITPTNKLIFI